jgi:hypothetical protein
LAIIDFRTQEFLEANDSKMIRNCYQLSTKKVQTWKDLVSHFEELDTKASKFELKYTQYKKIRRCVIIDNFTSTGKPGVIPENIQDHYTTLFESCKTHGILIDKYLYLNDFPTFLEKFPFLAIPHNIHSTISTEKKALTLHEGPIPQVTKSERLLLYTFARFPFIMLENEILLGNTFNANSSMQLIDLGIKSLVDITYIVDMDKKTGAKVNQELVAEKIEKVNKRLENPD